MKEQEGSPPVRAGDVLEIVPNGMAQDDPFVNYHGFIIFIKRVPKGREKDMMSIKVTAVKPKFGFAEFRAERS